MRTYLVGLTLSMSVLTLSANPNWTATLGPRGGSGIRGSASVESEGGPAPVVRDTMARDSARRDTTAYPTDQGGAEAAKASVSVEGARSGGMHIWHVHQGRCSDTPGAVVGDQNAYQPMTADERGRASASATLRGVTLKEGEEYSVSVHSGASPSDPVAACGDLRSSRGVPEKK
jgi:hypothetical protein